MQSITDYSKICNCVLDYDWLIFGFLLECMRGLVAATVIACSAAVDSALLTLYGDY